MLLKASATEGWLDTPIPMKSLAKCGFSDYGIDLYGRILNYNDNVYVIPFDKSLEQLSGKCVLQKIDPKTQQMELQIVDPEQMVAETFWPEYVEKTIPDTAYGPYKDRIAEVAAFQMILPTHRKPVPGTDGRYAVTMGGEIWDHIYKRRMPLIPTDTSTVVFLQGKEYDVADLVLKCFKDTDEKRDRGRPTNTKIKHLDGDIDNNNVNNLVRVEKDGEEPEIIEDKTPPLDPKVHAEVCRMLAEGYHNKEIIDTLGVDTAKVSTIRQRVTKDDQANPCVWCECPINETGNNLGHYTLRWTFPNSWSFGDTRKWNKEHNVENIYIRNINTYPIPKGYVPPNYPKYKA